MYDISTSNETKIASERRAPDIYGNYIAYTNDYNGEDHKHDGIYLYNLKAKKEIEIDNVYSFPAIFGKNVVWSKPNCKNGSDICKYDICTQKIRSITYTNSPISELDI
jgi:hypothetical protein